MDDDDDNAVPVASLVEPADIFEPGGSRGDRRIQQRHTLSRRNIQRAIAAFILLGEYDLHVMAHCMAWNVADFEAADEEDAAEIDTLRKQWTVCTEPVGLIRPYRCGKCGASLSLLPCVLCFCERE